MGKKLPTSTKKSKEVKTIKTPSSALLPTGKITKTVKKVVNKTKKDPVASKTVIKPASTKTTKGTKSTTKTTTTTTTTTNSTTKAGKEKKKHNDREKNI